MGLGPIPCHCPIEFAEIEGRRPVASGSRAAWVRARWSAPDGVAVPSK
jgi:hypothetical protein